MKVLVVDDREENIYMLQALLGARGHQMLQASNGEEALDVLRKSPVDLIVSDILMPVMDGFQLCRKVKTDERLRTIPFLIYTATYTGSQDEAFALKIGADRFLEKPCEPDRLLATIDEMASAVTPGAADREVVEDAEALKLYSERLVRKLEQKIIEAELEIKARQEVEAALRESESRFRLFADTAPVGVIIADKDQNAIYVSPKFQALFGYSREEIPTLEAWLNRAYPDPTLRDIVKGHWMAAVEEARSRQGEIVPMEFPVTCKDGTVRDIEFRMSTTGELDFVVFTDVSDRRRSEAERDRLQGQLFQAQKMETIGRLAGGVAHDFNNMLSVILGFTELSLATLKPGEPLHHNLLEIHNAATRSTVITRQLLGFARRQTIAPKALDLNGAIEGMLNMLRRLVGEDVEIVFLPCAGKASLLMDPSQLDQILINLCINARDAISDVGRVEISTEIKSLAPGDDAHPHDHPTKFIHLRVSDGGCGMDAETLQNIFEPFFTTKELGRGTGLGLSTVYGIVKQNHGFIEVESSRGKGSTFHIHLPLHHETPVLSVSPRAPEIPHGKGETILFVEDEPANLSLGKAMLERLGYRVLAAGTPAEALEIAGQPGQEIQMLLTDVVMPQMNGRDLAGRITHQRPGLRVLFISGYSSDVIAREGVLEEGLNFVQKPYTMRELAAKVRAALDS